MTKAHTAFQRNLYRYTAMLFCVFFFLPFSFASAGTKVAFVGDQGVNENAQQVLSMIKNEGTDLILIQGDFGYEDDSAYQWEQNIRDIFGKEFPVLSVIGNHDDDEWSDYRFYIERRVERARELDCSGEVGVKAYCTFRNIEVVQASPGIYWLPDNDSNDEYARYIDQSFASPDDKWRICSWHKNQKRMQTGGKEDATGWKVFESCLDAGAIVAMGHEHAYSRTHLLKDFENQTIVHKRDDMTIQSGQSIAFVSGLGGYEIRPEVPEAVGDWFASVYTSTQQAAYGALFCDFENTEASCYFRAINGATPDRFTLRRGSQVAEPPKPNAGYVYSRTDKAELRWVDVAANGKLANVWIDSECARSLGGVKEEGDWHALNRIAPQWDGIPNPCEAGTPSGYVFKRTDRPEFRWIDRDERGTLGSIWIDPDCVDQLGGVKASGDWRELNTLAPALDKIARPDCS